MELSEITIRYFYFEVRFSLWLATVAGDHSADYCVSASGKKPVSRRSSDKSSHAHWLVPWDAVHRRNVLQVHDPGTLDLFVKLPVLAFLEDVAKPQSEGNLARKKQKILHDF